ncbi:MAG TPA: hypothetical protein VFZ48_01355 [Candidatus Saccharimonadales bacterium]
MYKTIKTNMQLPFFNRIQLQTQPIDDGDELAQAITDDPVLHDNNWELTETPDADALVAFWDEVATDIRKDPDWNDFTE